MSDSATLTMLVSIISSSAPSATATATAHLFTGLARLVSTSAGLTACAPMGSTLAARIDLQLDAHAGAQDDLLRQLVDAHAHGHPLHHLGEVAGGVVGRQ